MTEEQTDGRTYGSLAKALAAFQAEAPTIAKNKTANTGTYSYTYADLADIAEQAYPILARHGLAFTSVPQAGELVGMLIHESGEYVSGSLPITGQNMQQIGSSLTYGRRYLLGCLSGIVTDTDDDGHLASQAKPARQRKSAARPETKTTAAPASADVRTDAQSKKLAVEMKTAGLDQNRDEALAYFGSLIGRPVESTKELTKAEASKIIDTLVDANSSGANPQTGEVPSPAANVDPWAERP